MEEPNRYLDATIRSLLDHESRIIRIMAASLLQELMHQDKEKREDPAVKQ